MGKAEEEMTVRCEYRDGGEKIRVEDTQNPDAWIESDKTFEDVASIHTLMEPTHAH